MIRFKKLNLRLSATFSPFAPALFGAGGAFACSLAATAVATPDYSEL
jgi:hypothetical protein